MTALLETPADDIFAKVKRLRDAGASIEQIKGYLATKGHISESGFTPFADTPTEPTETRPSLLSRAGSGVIGAIKQAATHPLDTAAGMASAPIHSLSDAFSPGVGEARHDPRLSKGGNSSGRPIDTSPYDAEHGGVTGEQRAAGTAQVLANIVAPGMSKSLAGLTAAGGTLGAAYNPGDPAAGFLTGATLAPAVGGLAKAAPAAVSFARQIPPGGLRDVGLSLVPARPLRAIKALRALTPDDVATKGSGPARLVTPTEEAPAPTAPSADPTALSDAASQKLLDLGVPPEKVAQAKVRQSVNTPSSVLNAVKSQRPQTMDAQMADLLRKARNAQPNEIGATYGDAEEAMGLAPHQQPDLEDLLRRSIAALGKKPPTP